VKLYYVHDPMCSWCWAFRPVWQSLKAQLPDNVNLHYLLGGLAADSDAPMSAAVQRMVQGHWQKIQRVVPQTVLNFDFWELCEPRRSTYPACRAVIAARAQDVSNEDAMILAIQQAYYLQAQNPSDDEVLTACADSIGLNTKQFASDLNSPETERQLMYEIGLTQCIGAQGFPSLMAEVRGGSHNISLDYLSAQPMLQQIQGLLAD